MSESFNQFRKQISSGLEKKRWSAKSVVAIILFGAIILVFVLFGFPNRLNNQGGAAMGSAARVNNALIPIADLRSESQRMEQMYAPLFGGAQMGDAQRQFVMQQSLESLITQELASQMAQKEGILATDVEVRDVIALEIPAFQRDGRFQRDLYYQLLEANRLNPAEFEARLRKEKANQRTQRLFEASAEPLKFEVEKLKSLQETKMNVFFARVDKDKVLSGMKITEGDVKAKLAQGDFAQKVQDYYNTNKSEFQVEPEVRAQHILVKIDAKKDAVQAKKEIEALKARAQTEDFGKLAAQYSEDVGSKVKNGDLGFFGKGRMVPEFENVAFSQKVGEVSEPVKSPFGYHLIKVLEKREARLKPFEEVQTAIAQKLIGTDLYTAETKALEEALAKGDQAAVDAHLKKLGVSWEETGFFDLSTDVIPKLSSAEASKAAFELSDAKKVYPRLVRDGPEQFVLKWKESKREAAAAANVDHLHDQLQRERMSDLFRQWIEDGKKNARIERNMQALQ